MLERVLSVPAPDIVEDLFGEFAINPIELQADQMDTPGAVDAPVSVEGAGRKIRVDGTRIEFRIPFSGDADVFDLRPSSFTMNRPRFRYMDSHVIVSYEGRSPVDKDAAKARLDSVIERASDHAAMLRRRAAAGEAKIIRMVAEGHAEVWEQGCSHVEAHRDRWLQILDG